MNGGITRVITFAFLTFSLLFFFVYRPLAHRADYEEAVLSSVSTQVKEQESIIALGPPVDAANKVLQARLSALRAKCAPKCNDVVATADEVAAFRVIARKAGVVIGSRTFNTDGTLDLITDSSQGSALRFLDALQRLPVPIHLNKTTFTADGRKVKMELTGQTVSGATL